MTHKAQIGPDAVEYFLTSSEYKSYVSQHAIIAIKNQLRNYIVFYQAALRTNEDIEKAYNLPRNEKQRKLNTHFSKSEAIYINDIYKDTVRISEQNDSLFLASSWSEQINLTPVTNRRFYWLTKVYFFSFSSSRDSSSSYDLTMHLLV